MPNARQSGIYAIHNTATGGFYIGSSTNLAVRKRNHFTDLRCGVHGNPHLQNSWNKHGSAAFRWEVVAVLDEDQTLATEGRLLARLFEHPLCYNIVREAVSGLTKRQLSPLSRERMLAAHVGRKQSPDWVEKRAVHLRGKKRRPESVALSAAGNRGKKRTPEQRARIAAYRPTEEHRAKMSAAKRGKCQSEATKTKRAAAMRERWADPDYRARVLAARPNTPEIVAKRAASNRGKKKPESWRDKMKDVWRRQSEALKGKSQSPELIAKRAAGIRAFHQRKRGVSNVP